MTPEEITFRIEHPRWYALLIDITNAAAMILSGFFYGMGAIIAYALAKALGWF